MVLDGIGIWFILLLKFNAIQRLGSFRPFGTYVIVVESHLLNERITISCHSH